MATEGSLEVVDILAEPERAIADKIFATPGIIKELPEPVSRVIGDISDPTKVLLLLGLIGTEWADVRPDE